MNKKTLARIAAWYLLIGLVLWLILLTFSNTAWNTLPNATMLENLKFHIGWVFFWPIKILQVLI